MSGGREERERERIPSRLCAVSVDPDTGLNPTVWDHDLSRDQEWTEPPRYPKIRQFQIIPFTAVLRSIITET